MKTCWWLCLCSLIVQTALGDASEYTEVAGKDLKLAPEDYKSKRVAYTAVFRNVSTTFLPYMDKSGFSGKKYLWLVAGEAALPVMARKSESMTTLVSGLKRGNRIKVCGKVKSFKTKPKQTLHPHYYLLVDSIEVVGDEGPLAPGAPPPPRRRPRRRP